MKVLAVTGGHSFDRDAFDDFLGALPFDVVWVEQPEALDWLNPARLADIAASLHYDMPGVRPTASPAPRHVVDGIAALASAGHGFVVLHHALSSWPAWPGWSDMVGGQYLYRPGVVRGAEWPDSGYREDVAQHLTPVDPSHPVLEGLAEGLDVVDETYLCPVFEDDVVPLLRTDAEIAHTVHHSTVAATVPGWTGDWTHPTGSSLAAWARMVDKSRLVYIQPGDTAATLTQDGYRRLVTNALHWVAAPRP